MNKQIMTKKCKTCKKVKPTDKFYTHTTGTVINNCKRCHNDKRRNTPEKMRQSGKYLMKRYRNDPQFRISYNMREKIRYHLWKSPKTTGLIKFIGLDRDSYFKYLEDKFEDGMTWENYGLGRGKWNIDHITPTSEFDMTDDKELKEAFHYTNTQPLWHTENSKNNK